MKLVDVQRDRISSITIEYTLDEILTLYLVASKNTTAAFNEECDKFGMQRLKVPKDNNGLKKDRPYQLFSKLKRILEEEGVCPGQ